MKLEEQLRVYAERVAEQAPPVEIEEVWYERSGAGPVRPLFDRRSRPRRDWRYAAAAAAVVVLALTGAWLLISDGSGEPDVGSSPAEVARAFIELGHAGDTESAVGLLASQTGVGSRHEVEPWLLLGGIPEAEGYLAPPMDLSAQRRVLEGLLLLEGLLGGSVESVDCESVAFSVDPTDLPRDARVGTQCAVRVSNSFMSGTDGVHPWFVVVRSGMIRYVDPHAPFEMGWVPDAITKAGLAEQHQSACNPDGDPVDLDTPFFAQQAPLGLSPDPVALARSCGSFLAEHRTEILAHAPQSDAVSPSETARRFFDSAHDGDIATALSLAAPDIELGDHGGATLTWLLLGGYEWPQTHAVPEFRGHQELQVLAGLLQLEGSLGADIDRIECADTAEAATLCSVEVSNPITRAGVSVTPSAPWQLIIRDGTIQRVDVSGPYGMEYVPVAIEALGLRDDQLAACDPSGDPDDEHHPLSSPEAFPNLAGDPVQIAQSCGRFLAEHREEILTYLVDQRDTLIP